MNQNIKLLIHACIAYIIYFFLLWHNYFHLFLITLAIESGISVNYFYNDKLKKINSEHSEIVMDSIIVSLILFPILVMLSVNINVPNTWDEIFCLNAYFYAIAFAIRTFWIHVTLNDHCYLKSNPVKSFFLIKLLAILFINGILILINYIIDMFNH